MKASNAVAPDANKVFLDPLLATLDAKTDINN